MKVPARPVSVPNETFRNSVEETVEEVVRLPVDLREDIMRICQFRGISFIDYARVALRGAVKTDRVYGPLDVLKFGKFYGEQLQYVMRVDPSYIIWCRDNIASFTMNKEALEMLDSVIEGNIEAADTSTEPPWE